MNVWRVCFGLGLAIVGVTGTAVVLALALGGGPQRLAEPGPDTVSANATCNTILTEAVSANTTNRLTVADPTGCDDNDWIVINPCGSTEEGATILKVIGNWVYTTYLVAYDHGGGEGVQEVVQCATPTPTPEPTATATPEPTATATPEPTATATPEPTATATPKPKADQMRNCPQAGKWAIAMWDGDDTEPGEALDTCGEEAVEAAYSLDPDSQKWLGHFPGRPDLSNLEIVRDKEGLIVQGKATLAAHIASVSSRDKWNRQIYVMNPDGTGEMHGCPEAGKWAIVVWEGGNGVGIGEALDTCEEEVDFAYYMDPSSQMWLGYFPGRPDLTKKETVNDNQGLIAHGKATP